MGSDTATMEPRQAARTVPPRRAGSVRRTSSIEMAWPDGRYGDTVMRGHARDVATHRVGDAPQVLAEDRLTARIAADKTIITLSTAPPVAGLDTLVGTSVIAGFRKRLAAIPGVAGIAGRPLALLLDDLVGCNIISGWVWCRWIEDRAELLRWSGDPRAMENACVSYAPGASVFEGDAYLAKVDPVPSLPPADDPFALHPLAPDAPQTMRRVRVIDVTDEGDTIAVSAMFQDSGIVPGGTRSAVHEYAVRATVDVRTHVLLSVEATPGVLPHRECVQAPANLTRLIGTPLDELRATVLSELRGTAGCTHLNDAIRALAEAAQLIAARDRVGEEARCSS